MLTVSKLHTDSPVGTPVSTQVPQFPVATVVGTKNQPLIKLTHIRTVFVRTCVLRRREREQAFASRGVTDKFYHIISDGGLVLTVRGCYPRPAPCGHHNGDHTKVLHAVLPFRKGPYVNNLPSTPVEIHRSLTTLG